MTWLAVAGGPKINSKCNNKISSIYMFQSRETIALSNEFTNLPVTQTQKHENEPKSCLGVENDSDLVKNNSHHSSGLSNHPTFSESESINV